MGSFIFANPASGSYAEKHIAETAAFLEAAGITAAICRVRTPQEVHNACATMYRTDDHPCAIIAAGDGTINAVINCLIPGNSTLAVLPLGSSNVLAAELGIRSLNHGLQRIVRGNSRSLSVGQLDLSGTRHRFALMAGIGLDGAVVRDIQGTEKKMLRQGAYLLSVLRNCLSWECDTIEVITESGAIECHTAVICNASRYGGDFILAPETCIFSSGFVVACMQGGRRRNYLGAGFDLLRGHAGSSPHIRQIVCREVEIRGRRPVQIDGDFVGYSPAKLTAVSDVCRIIV